MNSFSPWVTQHGYIALAIGALLEGETVLLLAGAAAQEGLLQWPWVLLIGALAGFAGDTLLFAIGRWRAPSLYERWPLLAERVRPRLNGWLARHAGLTVIAVRFAYGLRIAGPLVLGTSSLRWERFVSFNALGAIVWAGICCGLGGLVGMASVAWLHAFDHLGARPLLPALAIAIVGIAVWGRRRVIKALRRRPPRTVER